MSRMSPVRTVCAVLLCVWVAGGCATQTSRGGIDPRMSQLRIREFQTRAYETDDTLMVMKAVLNVLQDEFFIVKSADAPLGLITAAKELDLDDRGFFSRLFADADDRWKKNGIIECSANVSKFGTRTRVRINFQMKTFDNTGAVMEVLQIQDPLYYQNFFTKVDKGIFIARENL